QTVATPIPPADPAAAHRSARSTGLWVCALHAASRHTPADAQPPRESPPHAPSRSASAPPPPTPRPSPHRPCVRASSIPKEFAAASSTPPKTARHSPARTPPLQNSFLHLSTIKTKHPSIRLLPWRKRLTSPGP